MMHATNQMRKATEAQLEVCAKHSVEAMPPLSSEKAGIAIASRGLLPLNAHRHPVQGDVCGWYIWGGEALSAAPDFFQALHVGHLGEYVASLIPFLALPPGYRVLLAPDCEDVWFDETLLRD